MSNGGHRWEGEAYRADLEMVAFVQLVELGVDVVGMAAAVDDDTELF